MQYKLDDSWKDVQEVIVYGFGQVGKTHIDFIRKSLSVLLIIDSNKTMSEFDGIPIRTLADAKCYLKKHKILIMAAKVNGKSIAEDLNKEGLQENVDYCFIDNFLTEWFWRYHKKAYLFQLHTSITTRCTFRCKNCNMFMPYYKQQFDYTSDDVLQDFDLLFEHIDYVFRLFILGGEPLLNRQLSDIIVELERKYKDRIGSIIIITNASILPDERLLEISKKYNIVYSISDYSDVIPYQERKDEFVNVLHKAGISCVEYKSLLWRDFCFPEKKLLLTDEEARTHMHSCNPLFHGINDGKLYYCHVAWSAEKSKLYKNKKGDFIDLHILESTSAHNKELILQQCRGEVENGYLSLCSMCGGCGDDNTRFVKAGVQMKGN